MKRYAIGVAVLAVTGTVCAQAVQWTEAEGGNGHWYQFTWLQTGCIDFSVDQAAQLGAHLVTVTSNEENMFIEPLIPNYNGGYSVALLGGFRTPDSGNPEEGWYWITGETWDFTAWSPHNDQPNDDWGVDEDWLTLYPSQHSGSWAGWHDSSGIECDNNEGEQAWIIEWSADCNGDGIVDYGQILDGTYADDDGNGVPDCCDAGEPCDAVQWTEAEGGNGHWYSYRLGDLNNAAWTALAEAEGAHLVTITSEAEGVFVEAVHDAAAPQSAYHTGGFQDTSAPDYAEPDGGWRWVTGEPWQYTNWGYSDGADQPDNLPDWGEGANIMGIRWQENGIWLDMSETTEWAAMFEWSADCNGDGIVDYGQILDGTYADDDGNGVPDCCELPGGCEDCNDNGVLDSEDLVNGTSQDCNANDIPDECESLADCDGDGTSDVCEILGGALDVNPADGVPDECQGLPAGACCVNGACMMGTAANCFAAEGSYAGDGVSCADAGCPPDCPTDVFADGVTDINDLLLILSEFGSVCP